MLSLIVKLLELQLARKHNGDWEKNQLHARHACPELLARCSKIVKKINCITELFACMMHQILRPPDLGGPARSRHLRRPIYGPAQPPRP
jgi:hypothetical protein